MSQFATEQALWDLSGNPANIQRYTEDPHGFLAGYALTDEEKRMIRDKDVRGLADQGNSQMLVMLFWNALSGGFDALPEYLGRMNTPSNT